MTALRKYTGIEIGRIVFACLIPFLHIPFLMNPTITVLKQYFARLGVPFFYAVSGMFLSEKLYRTADRLNFWKLYARRISRLLIVWILIYSPFVLRPTLYSIQRLFFLTPAFLWYLTGLLVASVPFFLVTNRTLLYTVAFVLYFIGTLFGGSYKWLVGGVPAYEAIFLTTRNGVFFGLPLMCLGELTWKTESPSFVKLIMSGILLIAEITFVGIHASSLDDRSMYFILPIFTYYLLIAIRQWNPQINCKNYGGISTAIYVMQFGFITIGGYIARLIGIEESQLAWIVWLCIVIIPPLVFIWLKDKKLGKFLF